MDFAKLKNKQKQSKEEAYILADEQAEEQVFNLIDYYDIDLTFDIPGILDDSDDTAQQSKEEKQAGSGIKQVIKDVGHWIKKGVIEIKRTPDDLVITHNLLLPIGEDSGDSTAMKELTYSSVKPKHTEKMAGLGDDYTFQQKAELLMAYLSDNPVTIINSMGVLDKRAARGIGILLLIAQ